MSYQIGSLDVGVSFMGDVSGLQQAAGGAGQAVDTFSKKTTGSLKDVQAESKRTEDSMARLATGINGAFIGGSVAVGLIKLKNTMLETSAAIIDAQVQLDKWSNGFKFGAGSMAAGTREMAFVREEAQRLGLELSGSATQYMKLVAASRGTAMEGEKTRKVFSGLAEAFTVMGVSGEQADRAMNAIVQMMSKGKVSAEEIRSQFSEHIPGSMAVAARAMGVTEAELNKLLETGQVMSADFLPKFAAQWSKEVAPAVEGAAKSMQASLNRYETAWLTFKQNVAQSGVSDFIGGQINILADALSNISTRMEDARGAGGGFWAQTAAGAAGVAQFVNPLNAFSYSAQSLDMRLKEAQESLVTLQERAKTSPESPFFRVEIAQTQLLIQELQRAAQAKAMLDVAPGPMGSVGSGDSALARASRADYEKRLAAYNGLMASLASPQEKFSTELAKQKALLGDLFTPDVEARLRAHYIKPVGKALKEVGDEFVSQREAAKGWADAVGDFAKIQRDVEASSDGLSKAQARLVEYLGSTAYTNASEEMQQLALGQAYAAIEAEKLAAAIKAENESIRAAVNAWADLVEAQQGNAQTAQQALEAQLAQNETIGLGVLALAELEAAKLLDTAASKEQRAAALDIIDTTGQLGDAYRAEAKALRDLASAKTIGAAKQVAADTAKDAAEEWKRTSQQIEQSLTDALMRGFESGKGFAEVLRDTVANMFRTLVLRPVVQATVQGGLNAVGLGSLGGQGGNAANLLGAGNLYNSFATSSAGSALGLSTPLVDVLGTGSAGSALTGAGASLGAAVPYIGAVLAVGSLIKSLDDSGTMHTGGLGAYSAALGGSTGNAVKAQNAGFFNLSANDYQASTEQASVALAQSLVGLLDSTAATFGQQAGYYAATAFADDTSKDGAWGALLVKLGDRVLADFGPGGAGYLGKEFANGEEGAKQYAAAVATTVRDLLVAQTPDWADAMLRALGDAPTIEQLAATVGQINAAAAALDAMGQASQAFAALGESATGTLIAALGGAEAAVVSLSGYYGNFYTEAERAAIATQQLTGQLAEMGVALPTSREAFRALVDAALAAGNTTLAANLINLQGAFAAITQSAEQAAQAAYSAAEQLANQQKGLFKTWLQTIGDTAQLRAIELAELNDAHSQFIQQSIWDYQDQQAAAEKAAQAAAEYTATLKEQQDFMAGIARTVREWMDGRTATAGTPTQNLGSARAAFDAQLALAQAGNREALSGITGYADRLISAGEQRLGYMEGRQLIASVMQQVASLPGIQPADDPMLAVLNTIAAHTAATAESVGTGLTFDSNDPLRSVWEATSRGAQKTADLLDKATNGTLGMFVSLARQHNAEGVLDIGTTLWRAASLWGGDGPRVQVQGTIAAAASTATTATAAATGPATIPSFVIGGTMPSYDVGTNYVPTDGPAYLHQGEAVVPKAYNPAAGGYSDFGRGFEAMAAEIKALRGQVARLEAAANSSATSNALAADSLRSINRDGVQVLGTGDAAVPTIKVEVITP